MGKSIATKESQPSINPLIVVFSDNVNIERSIDVKEVQLLIKEFISSIFSGLDFGKMTDSNDLQCENIDCIPVTFVREIFERSIDFNDEHR